MPPPKNIIIVNGPDAAALLAASKFWLEGA